MTAPLPLLVRRCALASGSAGIVQVLAAAPATSVRVSLFAARPGQLPYQRTFPLPPSSRDTAAGGLPAGYPTGNATVMAMDATGRMVARALLGPYR